jgi:hypothetical protein
VVGGRTPRGGVGGIRWGQSKPTRGKATDGRLSNMDSYALGLLLGGLRGPLVMFLWSTSEAQKSAHDLEDFDTKVEWIRLLAAGVRHRAFVPDLEQGLQRVGADGQSAQQVLRPSWMRWITPTAWTSQRPDDINIIYDSMGNLFGDKMAGLQLPAD